MGNSQWDVEAHSPHISAQQMFRPDRFGVAFLSRGRGRGHIIPDIAIASELQRLRPDTDVRFVSYATGAAACRSCGIDVIDLKAAEDPPLLKMIVLETRALAALRPGLVVAHEEFAALAAAKVYNCPCIFITDFFQDPTTGPMQALRYASDIIFTAEAGVFPEPPYLHGRVHYVGRAVRQFEYGVADRLRARAERHIPGNATVLLFQPGGWIESRLPVMDVFLRAWDHLSVPSKHLIWIAGSDYELVSSKLQQRVDVTVLKEESHMDRLFVASDLVITKANRLTVYEAASLGVPSLSLTNFLNWPDDVGISNVKSNTTVEMSSLDGPGLAEQITAVLAQNAAAPPTPHPSRGIVGAAELIAAAVDYLRTDQSADAAKAGGRN